jgi:hypothetical protein
LPELLVGPYAGFDKPSYNDVFLSGCHIDLVRLVVASMTFQPFKDVCFNHLERLYGGRYLLFGGHAKPLGNKIYQYSRVNIKRKELGGGCMCRFRGQRG